MKPLFIFCHGWGFDQQFFEPLIKEYFPTISCYSLDLGYFGNEKIEFPTDQPFIGVGHSLGFIKLLSLKVKFTALIGIQAFINFLGFDPQLQKKRKLELKTMFNYFQSNPIDTLRSFHKRCGLDYTLSKNFNTTKLIQDLGLLATTHPLSPIPLLIIGAKNDTLVIFDEVMSGFGRTGTYFCFEQMKIIPDFLCLAKGLTGGFLPLALTVTTEKVYKIFWDDSLKKSFAHGHSYTANPLGCAAAIASLDLLMQPSTMESIQTIHHTHTKAIANLPVKHRRVTGTIAAFDLDNPQSLKRKCLEQGLLIRPLGNAVYLLPPYSTTASALEEAYKKINNILKVI
ncbi:aminotransferase class III-fold pyridoxal phosphate-dependent enzyme [Candidatus Cardinium hertigii]|uniref:aminotransferase class III-fold pyridoxal phosphate-dependent enzyme n=1 Tax=Candidatus Cardinium hertigii TaxID=247481 RepID=UPI003D7DEC60